MPGIHPTRTPALAAVVMLSKNRDVDVDAPTVQYNGRFMISAASVGEDGGIVRGYPRAQRG
jgi:hypothetical protein